jgi:hypothetical protein
MDKFKITDSAKVQILRIFKKSGYKDPVVRLCERADADLFFEDIKNSIIDEENQNKEVLKNVYKRFKEVEDKLESFLAVDVLDKTDCPEEDIESINGINILMGGRSSRLFENCCLTFDGMHFFLVDSDNIYHTLRSLAEKRYKGNSND